MKTQSMVVKNLNKKLSNNGYNEVLKNFSKETLVYVTEFNITNSVVIKNLKNKTLLLIEKI